MKKTSRLFAITCSAMLLSFSNVACAHAHEEGEEAKNTSTTELSVAAVVVPVDNIQAAETFYEETLGAVLVRRSNTEKYNESIFGLQDSTSARLVLIEDLTDKSELGPVRIVFNTQDAKARVEALKQAGGDVQREAIPVPNAGSLIIAITTDPFGNTLEFIQR